MAFGASSLCEACSVERCILVARQPFTAVLFSALPSLVSRGALGLHDRRTAAKHATLGDSPRYCAMAEW